MKRSRLLPLGIAAVSLALLAGCAKTEQAAIPSVSAAQKKTMVTIQNFQFSPANVTIKKGTTVLWTNKDSASHTVTGDGAGPRSGRFAAGKTFMYTFHEAGTFPYHCALHNRMKGTVTVTP